MLLGGNIMNRLLLLIIVPLVTVLLMACTVQPSRAQSPVQRILVTGGMLQGSNGMNVDDANQLYVVNAFSRQISIIDRDTGLMLRQLGPAEGVGAPDDLAIGSDGAIYWTEPLLNQVRKYGADGQTDVIAQFDGGGVNAITFAEDGRLFVAFCLGGETIYEIDPEGADAPRVVAENVGQGTGCALNGMDFGPDGLLYGPRMFLGDIVKVNVETGVITAVADGFTMPVAVKFNSQGDLFVNETPDLFTGLGTNGTVWRVDLPSGEKERLVTLPFGLDNLAIDATDRLFVSSQTNGAVTEIPMEPMTNTQSSTLSTVVSGGMILPGGAALHQGSLYVADFFHLRQFDPTTGEQKSSLGAPIGVTTVRSDGDNLLLTSAFLQAVQVRNPKTNEILENHTGFAAPLNAIRFQGKIVVADLATGSLIQVDGDIRTPLATDLLVPAGLAATDDDLWVTEFGTGKLLQIVAAGQLLTQPITIASGLVAPEGLAVGTENNLLVVESGNGRLSSIDLATGERITLAESLPIGIPAPEQTLPTWIFNGITVDEQGVIYVTADRANQLYRFDPIRQIMIPFVVK